MTDERNFNVDRVLQAHGPNMPPELIDYGAKMLKPVENFFGSYLRLLDNLDNTKVVDSWHAMDTWLNDGIPMAGATYRQLIVDFYRENRLIKGTLSLRGEPVDLGRLRANLLDVIAEDDHITPPCQSETVVEKVGSADKQALRVPGGHIGVMAGSGAAKGTWPKIDAWLAERGRFVARRSTCVGFTRVSTGPAIKVMVRGVAGSSASAISEIAASASTLGWQTARTCTSEPRV
jgi:polyhydroxyalkanoate synthase subunit PhaC